jgi:hypothetical protein
MTVKVVSDRPVEVKHLICEKCGYKLEYTNEDIRVTRTRDMKGDSERHEWIDCPRESCKKANRVGGRY